MAKTMCGLVLGICIVPIVMIEALGAAADDEVIENGPNLNCRASSQIPKY